MANHFLQTFFGKPVDEIQLKDVELFFSSEQEETSTLEFKTGEIEIISLYKEIAAFLNTEGGLIIVGAPREQKKVVGKSEKRICQGEITFSNFSSKDWLIQKFYANITPAPTDIYIKDFLTERGNVFLIEVPQSSTPPHQCNADGRYYIRMEGEAKPAPHGLVQALFDKRKKPKLNCRVNVSVINNVENDIKVSIFNESNIPADKVSFVIDVYNVISIVSQDKYEKISDSEYGDKLTYSRSTSQVLPRFLDIQNNLRVQHNSGRRYVIFIIYYAKELDFNGKYLIIDPATGHIDKDYECFNEDITLKEILSRL